MPTRRRTSARAAATTLILGGALAFGLPAGAQAATIAVDEATDETTDDGDCSLREAVTSANLNSVQDACIAGGSGADTIQLQAAGPYVLSSGELAVTESLTVMGTTGTRSGRVIDSNLASRAFNASAPLTVRDLTIKRGSVGAGSGGAISSSAAVTATNAAFEDSSAPDGGAIAATGAVTVNGSVFDNDDATTGSGGAIDAGSGTVTITDSEFQDHDAIVQGGVISATGTVNLNGENQFKKNTVGASGKGGVVATAGAVNVTGSSSFGGLLAGQENTAGSGGGAAIWAGGNVDVNGNHQFTNNDSAESGGAIHVESPATLTLRNGADFSGNDTTNGIGGCANADEITVQAGSTFSDNSALGGGGCLFASTISVTGATFQSNDSTGGFGGAISSDTSLTVTGSTFGGPIAGQGNAADDAGGAIAVVGGAATITGSSFEANSTIGDGDGGAVYAVQFATTDTLEVSTSRFAGNVAGSSVTSFNDGGAIALDGGHLEVSDSTFSSNVARGTTANGGAIRLATTATTNSIENSTLTANVAASHGGSVLLDNNAGLTVGSSTFYDNDSASGDLVNFSGGTVALGRSIVADDPAETADGVNCMGDLTFADDGSNVIFPPADVGDCPTGGTNSTGDPALGPLVANGGITQTMLPGAGSAAVDLIPTGAECTAGPPDDQRGVNRPVGPGCDAGAVEVDSRPDALVRKGTEPFVGNGVYESPPTTQAVTAKAKDGKTAKFTVEVQSDATFLSEPYLLTGTAGNAKFKTTYKIGGDNKTAEITGAGFTTADVAPAGQLDVEVAVKIKKGTKKGKQLALTLTGASPAYAGHLDSVEMTAIAK